MIMNGNIKMKNGKYISNKKNTDYQWIRNYKCKKKRGEIFQKHEYPGGK